MAESDNESDFASAESDQEVPETAAAHTCTLSHACAAIILKCRYRGTQNLVFLDVGM